MTEKKVRKRKPGGGRKPNLIPTKAVRLPLPLVNQIMDLKKKGKLGPDGMMPSHVLSSLPIPLFESRVQAGFPSPADDFSEGMLDLNSHLIKNKAATFFVRVTGDSMTGVGIFPGDILVVDRSLPQSEGKIVIAVLNGEMTVKRLKQKGDTVLLCSENDKYPPISVSQEEDLTIWGVVTNVIHALA